MPQGFCPSGFYGTGVLEHPPGSFFCFPHYIILRCGFGENRRGYFTFGGCVSFQEGVIEYLQGSKTKWKSETEARM